MSSKTLFRPLTVAAAVSLTLASPGLFAETGCPTGYVPDGTETLIDPEFSQGYGSFSSDIPKKFPVGTYPTDGNGSAYPNTAIALITGDINLDQYVQQIAFPGDPTPGGGLPAVPAVDTWLAYNGTDTGAPTKIWEQTVSGLEPNKDYAFTAYFSNAMAPGQQATDYAAPQVNFLVDGTAVNSTPIVVCDSGNTVIDTTDGSCTVEATADKWQRLGLTVNPGNKTTLTLSIHDAQQYPLKGGNDFAMTLISFQKCVPIGTPDIAVNSTTVIFPAYTPGGNAVSRSVTVRNAGSGSLAIGNIANPANGDFTIVNDGCSGQSLAANETCTIELQFSTTGSGDQTATLDIPSNDPDENPLTLTLKAGAGLDSDGDGILDSDDLDDDNDGIPDSVEGDADVDGDGIPNRLDLDSDNDGIPDVTEALGSDSNADGRIDGFTDANGDGLHDPLENKPLPRPDTDGDGKHDHVDLDSDGDGRFDIVEVGIADSNGDGMIDDFTDSDGDGDGWEKGRYVAVLGDDGSLRDSDDNGTPDYRQGKGEILTRLDGGVGGLGLPFALGLLPLALRRRRLLAAAALLGVGAQAQAEQGQFFVGGGFGMSQLEPEIVNLPLTVSDDRDKTLKLVLGYDLLDWLSLEGFYARMGAAGISDGGEIDYASYGAGLVVNLPNNAAGWSLLGRLGYGEIDNDSKDVDYREVEDYEIYAGIGVEYQFDNDFSLRGEYDYIDKDAKMLTFSLVKRFGGKPDIAPPPVIPAPEPEVVATVEEPAPTPPPAKPVEVITLVLEPIHFDTDSAALTPVARERLDQVVRVMEAHPQVELLIVGHTDDRASDDYNMALSLRRAKAAADYLIGKGIDRKRLTWEGRGEREPVADNATETGRAQNRRVEFEPTPNRVEKQP